jgi:hypothetical protein
MKYPGEYPLQFPVRGGNVSRYTISDYTTVIFVCAQDRYLLLAPITHPFLSAADCLAERVQSQ